MLKKLFIIIIIIIIIVVVYLLLGPFGFEKLTEQEEACIDAGGTLGTMMCCKLTSDFPNTCLIGPCGCAPENSHEIKICHCGENKCFNGSKCLSMEEVSTLLESLEQETRIDFSEIKDVEFTWYLKEGEKEISGKGFEAKEISDEQYTEIENFFQSRGFFIDQYNISAGTVAGAVGFQKDEFVCNLAAGVSGYVDIKCGKLEVVFEEE